MSLWSVTDAPLGEDGKRGFYVEREGAAATPTGRTIVKWFETREQADAYLGRLQEAVMRAVKTPITMKVDGEEKYPISDQKSANSAWKLRKHGKGVSEEQVKAHIGRAVKALGLKHPADDDAEDKKDGGKDEDSEDS